MSITATIPVGNGPLGMAISPNGLRVYVTNFGSGSVSVIDTTTNTVTATVKVGSGPRGVEVTPNGLYVYVINYGDGTVSVIDTASNTVVHTITGLASPAGVGFSVDGLHAYVGDQRANAVLVIDTTSNTVTTAIPVGITPYNVTVSHNGARIYVTNFGSETVSVIDSATNTVIDTINGFQLPRGMAITPDDSILYVTNYGGTTVSVVDTHTDTIVHTIDAPIPFMVKVAADGVLAYVTVDGTSSLEVIDTATNTLVATIPGFNVPNWLVITPDSRRIYVVNNGNGTVSVVTQHQPGISPNQGPTGGGTTVTITGHGFDGATDVRFGSRPAISFTVVNDQSISAITPAGFGRVPVTVTTTGGKRIISNFYYLTPPSLTDLAPTSGPKGGGNTITLNGSGFSSAQTVHFGAATVVATLVSDGQLTATAPASVTTGTVRVYVTTLGGVSNFRPYTYT